MASNEIDGERQSTDVEVYSSQRKAEFLLSNAIDKDDYEDAVTEVRQMGLNPDDIPHVKPFE